jgi:hypothetical protein
MEMLVYIFYVHLVYFTAIWYFSGYLVYFSQFWYVVARKIWKPGSESSCVRVRASGAKVKAAFRFSRLLRRTTEILKELCAREFHHIFPELGKMGTKTNFTIFFLSSARWIQKRISPFFPRARWYIEL